MNSTLMHADDSSNDAAQDKDAATIDSVHLMAEFSIVHGGRYYYYGGYRYERLADAVAYAQLVQTLQPQRSNASSLARFDAVESPSDSDRELMIELSISFKHGCFVFEGFRYDRLIDAVNYARHRRHCRVETP
jgi:hypothetical protein